VACIAPLRFLHGVKLMVSFCASPPVPRRLLPAAHVCGYAAVNIAVIYAAVGECLRDTPVLIFNIAVTCPTVSSKALPSTAWITPSTSLSKRTTECRGCLGRHPLRLDPALRLPRRALRGLSVFRTARCSSASMRFCILCVHVFDTRYPCCDAPLFNSINKGSAASATARPR
jgi:hypothetical protein